MSKAYICDITGVPVSADDIAEKVVKQVAVVFNGVSVSMEFIIRIDAFNGAQQTHLHPNEWPPIMQKIKQWIVSNYG